MIQRRPLCRSQLFVGVSAAALALAGAPAASAQTGPYTRGGVDPAASVARAATGQAEQAAVARSNAQQMRAALTRAVAVRQAMQQTQAAARAAALAAQSLVPNGLTAGGLQVDPAVAGDPSKWLNAKSPTQTTGSDGRVTVKIEQTGSKAILNWETFNVGRETDLTFQQGSSNWVVLNRVNDPNANPSQIMGTIKAPGTVLILNRNGVIFGGASQVNVGSLLAGAASRSDSDFLKFGIYSLTSSSFSPAFTNAGGKVKVEAGAQIQTTVPASVLDGGGYVMLLGGSVENAGTITTPKGQTLLAAGDGIALRPGVSGTDNLTSTTRGTEAFTQSTTQSANGFVTNSGTITATQGDITLTGRTVVQDGVLMSTSSVNQRGTIHLSTSSRDTLGSVMLGASSYTAIIPELESTDTALDSQRDTLLADSVKANTARNSLQSSADPFRNRSIIDDRKDLGRIEIVSGGDVGFTGGSLTQAQGAQVAVEAVGTISVGKDAIIDVSGVRNVALDVASNNLKVNIQGFELRDSPVNRDADGKPLYSQNVWVDARDLVYVPAGTDGYDSDRYYTAGRLIEAAGYLAGVKRSVGEWNALGGTITIRGTNLRADAGSVFDVSGGSIDYAGGYIRQSLLQGVDGKLYTIGKAPADMKFVSVGKSMQQMHDRWGPQYAETYQSPFKRTSVVAWEDGYSVGRSGGTVYVETGAAQFNGTVLADVITGEHQTNARSPIVGDPYKLGQNQAAIAGGLLVGIYDPVSRQVGGALNDVVLSNRALSADAPPTVYLNLDTVTGNGLGTLSLGSQGSVTIDGALHLADGGSLSLGGSNLVLKGDLTVRGGTITLATGLTPLTLDNITVDTRGIWSNLVLDPLNVAGLAFVNGGAINLSGPSIVLGPNSHLNATAGGAILPLNKTVGGAGGDITIRSLDSLKMDGDIQSYGFTHGGALTIQARVAIGGTGLSTPGLLGVGEVAPVDLLLSAGVTIPAGTVLSFALPITINSVSNGDTIAAGSQFKIQSGAPVTVGANGWTVPSEFSGYIISREGPFYFAGSQIPANYHIVGSNGKFSAAYVIPDGSFVGEVPVTPHTIVYAAGTTLQSPLKIAAGATIPRGATLPVAAPVKDVVDLDPSFFRSGFSNYTLLSNASTSIRPGVAVNVEQPVLRFTAESLKASTGSNAADVTALVLPDLFTENPLTGVLTQRAGASLTIGDPDTKAIVFGTGASSLNPGAFYLGKGASITVDPGQSVRIGSTSQITVDGTITAHAGTIDLVNHAQILGNAPSGQSVWIGATGVLDVSGIAHVAKDFNGERYGTVLDGGSITLGALRGSNPDTSGINSSPAFVVVRAGAVLDVSGASATLDLPAAPAPGGGARYVERLVGSDAGSITMNSYSGIVVEDGPTGPALRGNAGAAGARGGSLSIDIEAPGFAAPEAAIDALQKAPRQIWISQHNIDAGLPTDLAPGTYDASLTVGRASLSADQIEKGGFYSLDLFSRGGIVFDGNVSLSVGRSITLSQGPIYNSLSTGKVSLTAPYVSFDGQTSLIITNTDILEHYFPQFASTLPLGDTLSVNASLVDVRNTVESVYADTRIAVAGDLRLLAAANNALGTTVASPRSIFGAHGDLVIVADRVYPVSGALGTLAAGTVRAGTIDNPNFTLGGTGSTITIAHNPATKAVTPYSIFGDLIVSAETIEQGGNVYAPLGSVTLGTSNTKSVTLLNGSITSASAAGLLMPYGGTVDGIVYKADGNTIVPIDPVSGRFNTQIANSAGVLVQAGSLVAEQGSLIDVSGGGNLVGGAFISGRGGSVDTLLHPRNAGGQVYAIVPGATTAPVTGGYSTAWTGNSPEVGQEITIPAGVPGLPAGTYTLMPANYALLPGAYRIELGGSVDRDSTPVVARADGSYDLSGYQSIAGSDIHAALPTRITIADGKTLRSYSSYNEQSYTQFQVASAALTGAVVNSIEADGKLLTLRLGGDAQSAANSALQFKGEARIAAAKGGRDGALAVLTRIGSNGKGRDLVVTGADSTTVNSGTVTTIAASQIQAINAPQLYLGGVPSRQGGVVGVDVLYGNIYDPNSISTNLVIEGGVTLSASHIALVGRETVRVENGAVVTTIGKTFNGLDSSDGLLFGAHNYGYESAAFVLVSNGRFDLNTPNTVFNSKIAIEDGASLLSEGSISFYSNKGVDFGRTVNIGTKNLSFSVGSINIGTDASLGAAGALPAGIVLNQDLLDRLLNGAPQNGVPALERLALSANNSINFFGSVELNTLDPATGKSRLGELVLNSPAIYGYGDATDKVRIITDTLVWNGESIPIFNQNYNTFTYVSADPAARIVGLGNSGSFQVDANKVVFGYGGDSQTLSSLTFDRLMLGFGNVTFNAAQRVVANSRGTVSIYENGPSTGSGFDPATYAGSGGTVRFVTPLVTSDPGAQFTLRTSDLVITSTGSAAAPTNLDGLGGQISLIGRTIDLASSVVLPGGRLDLVAAGDLTLRSGTKIDLSGRTIKFYDVTKYSWGGDVSLTSTGGNVLMAAGASIDVSAAHSDGGSISVVARDTNAGRVVLDGTLAGLGAGGSFADGGFLLSARQLGDSGSTLNAAFADLNTRLNASGFFFSRSFTFGDGDLTVGDGVRARNVSIATDGGSLTVNGTIDASGRKAGAIRLSARDDLVIAGSGVLDLHGTVLDVDGRGAPIEATNRNSVELTSANGWVRMGGGASIDLSSPDAVDRGRIEINAGRQTETSGLRVDAPAPVTILGATSIAVNGFWTYTPTDADGTITQSASAPGVPAGAVILDQVDAASQAYYDAVTNDAGVQQALGGLRAYGARYHLRPGVEIVGGPSSHGNLRVLYDLDLAGYRYGANADRNPLSANYGAGEPMSLLLRAPGDLTINGSITDGFGKPLASPDDAGYRDRPLTIVQNVAPGRALGAGDTFDMPSNFKLAEDWTIPADWEDYNGVDQGVDYIDGLIASASPEANPEYFHPGDTIPAGYTILYTNYYQYHIPDYVPAQDLGSVSLPQAPIYAIAPMLAPGTLSATMRFVSGAKLDAADTRTVLSPDVLAGHGNTILDDYHERVAFGPYQAKPIFSVIRTGIGGLDLISGGDFTEKSQFGIYTAGTDSPLAQGEDAFHLPRVSGDYTPNGPVLPYYVPNGYNTAIENWRLYYPDHGGDLLLSVGGNLQTINTSLISDPWLWRQGAPDLGQKTAWGINFGTYVFGDTGLGVAGFNSIGTLGGGNLTVNIGGTTLPDNYNPATGVLYALNLAVGSTGRVTDVVRDGDSVVGGTLVQTGGGDLRLNVGGAAASGNNVLTNVRGNVDAAATSFGSFDLVYGMRFDDPRPADPLTPSLVQNLGAPLTLTLGDSVATFRTRADLAIGSVFDPGASYDYSSPYLFAARSTDGSQTYGAPRTWFTLETDRTGIELFSLGGSVEISGGSSRFREDMFDALPSRFAAIAASGNLYTGSLYSGSPSSVAVNYMMLPSRTGQLDLLAAGSVYGAQVSFNMSGADADYDSIPNPFKPAYILVNGVYAIQYNTRAVTTVIDGNAVLAPVYSLYAFDPNTPANNLHAGDPDPSHVYAATGDITGLLIGLAEETHVRAARDIVGFGGYAATYTNTIVHSDTNDVSTITAGRDIIYADVAISGPGSLEITAGHNIYLADQGSIVSAGAVADGDKRPGAGLLLAAGLGEAGADYDALRAYLDPANALGVNPQGQQIPLEGSGKVAHVYDKELIDWLGTQYGFKGDIKAALAFFDALPELERHGFLRQVFYAELTASGREYNDPDSSRAGSYLRGRNAIAALFPAKDAKGQQITYAGDITLFGKSGLRTLFGGDIQLLAPGGRIVAGVEGVVPPATAGIITQGQGNVESYSTGSLLLGLSRVLTTFGGNIIVWSAEGDINAGRGSKTTLLFTPPRLTYDIYGGTALAPQVPSTGAGVGTLNPIPEVKPGNVDLIAPLGTVDAGEAGIRVSGDLNIAALHVVNAANIEVQGQATGIPTIVAVNTGALTSASNAASAVSNQAEQFAERSRSRPIRTDIPSIVTGRFVGFGDSDDQKETR